ncbi:MAG: GAF domain-containing protein [Desulfomonile sp.]|nr:GAF domain-containing protein [Desulfomonile sp.]
MISHASSLVRLPSPNLARRLQDLVALAADVLDAFTAALLLEDEDGGHLKIMALQSLSDNIAVNSWLPMDGGFWTKLVRGGVPYHETYFEGDSARLGIYTSDEGIRAFMTAPVGEKGLLWVDTRRTYSFTAKHLKMLVELSATAVNILELAAIAEDAAQSARELNLIPELVPNFSDLATLDNRDLDRACALILETGGFDGVLTVSRVDERSLFRITASAGFPSWVRKGRLVKCDGGLVGWCTENKLPKLIVEADFGEALPIVFHRGEKLGLEAKTLAIVPWTDAEGDGAIVMASSRPNWRLDENRAWWESLGKVFALVSSVAFQQEVLGGIRRYDGESGLFSEGYFRAETRRVFARASAAKGSLVLLLVLVTDMDRLYLEHDHALVNRFLETLADQLEGITRRSAVAGKFRTGGLALLLEGLPPRERDRLSDKATGAFCSGRIQVGTEEISCNIRVAAAHYPSECSDLAGLWRKALNKLETPSSNE